MGSGMTGFLQGFLQTKLALDDFDQRKAQQQAQLDLQKENLKLHQQALKGQEAHLALQDQALQAQLGQQLRQQQAQEQLGNLFANGADMNDPVVRKNVLGIVGRTAGPDALLKLQEQFRTQDELAALNKTGLFQQSATPQAGAAPLSTAPAPQAPSPAFGQKVQQVAARLGLNADDLLRIMHFETGGTFDPSVRNRARSGATGLIQFMPDTAKALGTTTEALAKMAPEQQLDYVEKYLTPFKGRLGNLSDAYMAVLYPQAIGKGPNYILFKQGTPEYLQNAGLDTEKKGYVTAADATNAVLRTTGGAQPTMTARNVVPSGRLPQEQPSMVASAGAPATPSVGGQSAFLQATQADLQTAMQQRSQLTQQLDQYNALAGRISSGTARQELDRRIDNTRQALAQVETRIQNAQKYLEPSSEFTALLRKNNGDLTAALKEEQERKVDIARNTQAIGLENAADKAAKTELGKEQGKQTAKADLTLLDIKPQESRQYYDITTGKPLPQSSKYQAVKDRMEKGEVVFLDDQEAKEYRGIQRMVPLIEDIRKKIERVYGPGGIFENLTPAQRLQAAAAGGWARITQATPELAELNRTLKGNVDLLRRNLQGQVGTQTEGDAKRGLEALAKVDGIPDSQDVAYGMYNTLMGTMNGMFQHYLGNSQYQDPKLKPLGGQAAPSSAGSSGLEGMSNQELFDSLMNSGKGKK